jgi:hypothetical protein
MSADEGLSGPTGPTETVSDSVAATGPTGDIEPIPFLSLTGGTADPPRIRLTDLMTDLSILQQQEQTDRSAFSAVTSPDLQGIRTKLITWLANGKQGNCVLIRIPFAVPNVCSDGVARNFFEYVEFVSGTSLVTHIQSLQAILPDFEVGYQCSRTELLFCVVRVMV